MLLRNAGAIIIGHTDTPPMCQDIQASNPVVGTTANPFDAPQAVGGSSDSPAAVDLPTLCACPQACPRLPGWATSSYMIALGPIARSFEDLALLLDVIAAPPCGPGLLEDHPGGPGQVRPRPYRSPPGSLTHAAVSTARSAPSATRPAGSTSPAPSAWPLWFIPLPRLAPAWH
ncbi:amidase family protein [Streptomyces sp. NPDC015032]|uniref:amidase family protein n=1 Tax=Streptomyces sp. NPDC015032 TaxID=3364937 RepID=UPI0036F642C1